MAKIHVEAAVMASKNNRPFPDIVYFTPLERNKSIENYWRSRGNKEKRLFIITRDRFEEFMNTDGAKGVALRVESIDNDVKMKALWMPYDDKVLAGDETNDDVQYFVFMKKYYSGVAIHMAEVFEGMEDKDCLIISARIGEDNGKYFVLFNAASIDFRDGRKKDNDEDGAGAHGGDDCIRIPPL